MTATYAIPVFDAQGATPTPISDAARQYAVLGFGVFNLADAWPAGEHPHLPDAEQVRRVLCQWGQRRARTVGGKPGEPGPVRELRDHVLDGPGVQNWLPALAALYDPLRVLAELVARTRLVLSPHAQSAITAKWYDGPGAGHGWHVESNSVSAILCLSNTGSVLEVASWERLHLLLGPCRGQVIILRGKDLLHRVVPQQPGSQGDPFTYGRTTLVFNLYTPEDAQQPRPTGLDVLHYGA